MLYASHRIKKRGKLATRYINAMLRTALKKRKLAQRYMNAMLRTALKKRKTRDALHKCYASHRIKKRGKLAMRYINALCFASH
jgi:predicted transcriptional regulator